MLQPKDGFHVMSIPVDGRDVPLSVFVEPGACKSGDGTYLLLREVSDDYLIKHSEYMKFVKWEVAIQLWPEILERTKDAGLL